MSEQHLLNEGEFRAKAYHLGLEQELPADAWVDIFFVADLSRILEAVQQMYLAAHAPGCDWRIARQLVADECVLIFSSVGMGTLITRFSA